MQKYNWNGMMHEYGDIILKQTAQVIENDEHLRVELIDIIKSAIPINPKMQGLALPQLGILLRGIMCVHNGKQIFMFNPKIIKQSKIKKISNESCLSVKGRYYVKRPEYVSVLYEDITGKKCMIQGGWSISRILCHEIDHLNGICLPDIGTPVNK